MRSSSKLLCGLITWVVLIVVLLAVSAFGQIPQNSPGAQGSGTSVSPSETRPTPATQAQGDNQETTPAVSDFSFLRVGGGFGLVLSMIGLCYVAARKFAPQYFAKKTPKKNLKLVESLVMGEKRSLSIVEFDERRFLLGNTPSQITLLAELPGRLSVSSDIQISQTPSPASSRPKPSSESFKNIYDLEKGRPPKTNGRHIPPDIRAKMRQLRESLDQ